MPKSTLKNPTDETKKVAQELGEMEKNYISFMRKYTSLLRNEYFY
jgi:hypothetical protein